MFMGNGFADVAGTSTSEEVPRRLQQRVCPDVPLNLVCLLVSIIWLSRFIQKCAIAIYYFVLMCLV